MVLKVRTQAREANFFKPAEPSYPRIELDNVGYYYISNSVTTASHFLTTCKLRKIVLDPAEDIEPECMRDLHMTDSKNCLLLKPAHIPLISDVEFQSPLFMIMLRWAVGHIEEGDKLYGLLKNLLVLSDPVPILPPVVNQHKIRDDWLTWRTSSDSNAVTTAILPSEALQISLKTKWGDRANSEGRIFVTKLKVNNSKIFIRKLNSWIDPKRCTWKEREEFIRSRSVLVGLTVVHWNARGIARESFRENLKQLVKDHNTSLIIITESRVSINNTASVVEGLPLNRYELVEPQGFTGWIVIVWDDAVIKFKTVYKDLRALHGVLQGPAPPNLRNHHFVRDW